MDKRGRGCPSPVRSVVRPGILATEVRRSEIHCNTENTVRINLTITGRRFERAYFDRITRVTVSGLADSNDSHLILSERL